jgi:tyrosinase
MRHVSLSALDPVFFLHHANLDRLWAEWQSKDANRLTAMGGPLIALQALFSDAQPSSLGPDAFFPYFGDEGNVTTLRHNMWMGGIVPNITVADAMDIDGDKICIKYDK